MMVEVLNRVQTKIGSMGLSLPSVRRPSRMNSPRLPFLLLVCLVVTGSGGRPLHAQQPLVKIPGIKADALLIFGYYFTWPADAVPGDEFVIGVLGEAPFSNQRITQRFKTVRNKKIRVLSFDSARDYKPCHILFVADKPTARSVEKNAQSRLAAALNQINGGAVLVVTETAGQATKGAMINFIVDANQNRVKTEVNVAEIKKAGLGLTKHYVNYSKTALCIHVNPPPAAPGVQP